MECTALASFGKKTDDGCDRTLHFYISDLLCLTGLNNAQQEHAQEQPRLIKINNVIKGAVLFRSFKHEVELGFFCGICHRNDHQP